MTQRELNRAVACSTGESLSEIRRRGFSIVDPENVYFDPEPDLLAPQMIDWDEVDRQRNVFVVDYPLHPRRKIA